MTVQVVDAPDVIEPFDHDAAVRLDKRIRLLVGTIHESIAKLYYLVEQAKYGNVHVALGFPSWTAYLADVFTVTVRLEPCERREMVGYLSGEGMSNRAIAEVVGVSDMTVGRDLSGATNVAPAEVTGLDGKTYRRKPREDDDHNAEAPTELDAPEPTELDAADGFVAAGLSVIDGAIRVLKARIDYLTLDQLGQVRDVLDYAALDFLMDFEKEIEKWADAINLEDDDIYMKVMETALADGNLTRNDLPQKCNAILAQL